MNELKLEVGKTYVTREGSIVNILTKLKEDLCHPFIGIADNTRGKRASVVISSHGEIIGEGHWSSIAEEHKPYKDWPIDCKVRVRTTGEWTNRHFAGVNEEGKPLAWDNGQTSHSSKGLRTCWDHIERVD
jgi:hypothetical protein